MAFKILRLDNPAGWIAIGAVALLASPTIRKALRSVTVSAAVGVLKLGDSVKDMGSKVNHQTQDVVTEAMEKRDAWRTQTDSPNWVRESVVKGVASTLNAADNVTQGAKKWYQQVRRDVAAEVGEVGFVESSSHNLLPEHLLPKIVQNDTFKHAPNQHVPGDFAVRSTDMMSTFRDDVFSVGAEFKPEYERMANLLRPHTDA